MEELIDSLEDECSTCNGLGKISEETLSGRPYIFSCYKCHGRGKNISKIGLKIIDFINYYIKE